MPFQGIPYTEKPESDRSKKNCVVCSKEFIPRSGVNKFCSDSCRGRWKYLSGHLTTESQYKLISGNWDRYFSRLLKKKRHAISKQDLLDILQKQNGKCAISGVELTCKLEVGTRFKTNASIDRIIAGAEYSKENIQLVCSALNSWRADTDLQEFIWWCKQVTTWQESKE